MNPETWGHIHYLFAIEKMPKKVIARALGLSPKTIRRALKKKTLRAAGKPRTSKLEAFKDKISALRSAYPGISGVRILEEIRKLGYPDGISILRGYLASFPKTGPGLSPYPDGSGRGGPSRLDLRRHYRFPKK